MGRSRTAASNARRADAARQRRAVGYLRRSTDRQEQSIPDQRAAVETYARQRGLELLRCYVDDAISGTSTVGRQAFHDLIDDAARASCDFGVVVCYDVKRFGRVDNDEAGYYRHILRSHGVEVRYAAEDFTDTPGNDTDDLLRPVKQWQARQESKDLAKVVIRGLVSKTASKGHWMGGAPPFGYDLRYESHADHFIFTVRYQRNGSKRLLDQKSKLIRTLDRGESIAVSKRDHCRLVPGEKTRVALVRRLFALYAEDKIGFKGIAATLNREGAPTPRGPEWAPHYSGRWTVSTVRGILTNPAYAGDLVWNRRTDARFFRINGDGVAVDRGGATTRRLEHNDESDWLVTEDAHEALVPRSLWLAARERMRDRSTGAAGNGRRATADPRLGHANGKPPSGPRARFLLSGMAKCSRCGCTYEGRIDRSGSAGKRTAKERCYSYVCGGYIRQGRSVCSRGAIEQALLERAVVDALVGHYGRYAGDGGHAALERAVREAAGTAAVDVARARREAHARLDEIVDLTRTLLDNLTEANRDAVDERLAELTAERKGLEKRLGALDHMALTEAEVAAHVEEVARTLEKLERTLGEGPVEERRALVRRCVAGVVIDRDGCSARVAVRRVPLHFCEAVEEVAVPVAMTP